MDAYGSGGNPNTTGTHGTTLTDRAVRMWPTPKASDSGTATPSEGRRDSPALRYMATQTGGAPTSPQATSLTVQVKMWPTPKASEMRRGSDPDRGPAGGSKRLKHEAEASRHAPTTPTPGNDGSLKADLNPRFVAALMGVAWDWLTPYTSEETD